MVIEPGNKKQYRRLVRRRKRKINQLGHQADEQLERLFLKRLGRLQSVRRFVISWVMLFCLISLLLILQIRGLDAYFQTLKPVPGGIYTEGQVGNFTNSNPLYATASADSAISHLVFSGLFKYDQNNKLVGDLADHYTLDPKETRYTVYLKKNVQWQDGKPFSAQDVVFTYQAIQDLDTKSPMYASWQGIKVQKINDDIVTFILPNQLSSFPYALTTGIIPEHLLKSIPHSELRSAPFNAAPIGTGPFKWKFVEVKGDTAATREQRITLAPNTKYFAGRPKLDGYVLRTFRDEKPLIKSFQAKEINAMSGLETLPDELQDKDEVKTYSTPLTDAVMMFMNNSHPQFKDPKVRRALVESVDRSQILKLVEHPAAMVDEPLLHGQLAYDPRFQQAGYNMDDAGKLLDAAGWKYDSTGVRAQNKQQLEIGIRSQGTAQYIAVAQYIQQQWGALGVKVDVRYFSADDIQSEIIANHDYDALLYGISIGVDPDVYPYWHSSQAGITSQGHINLSEYKSAAADTALEAGRTRSNPALRTIKYKPFLASWQTDNPALGLYQPTYFYVSRGTVFGYERKAMNSGIDRFYNVNNWMIREEKRDI